jgi:hypothetical protein
MNRRRLCRSLLWLPPALSKPGEKRTVMVTLARSGSVAFRLARPSSSAATWRPVHARMSGMRSTIGALLVIALTFAAGAASGEPIPIPGGLLVPNPFGGPDIHFHRPGPVDSATPNAVGGDPSTIYNFNGIVGVAHVEGTGTDNSATTSSGTPTCAS